MTTCALFIDYENVVRSLRGQNVHPAHQQLAELFRTEASRYGEVVCARAFAPWDLYPEAMPVFDRHDIRPEYVEGGRKDNADLVMSLAIQEFLRIPGRDADVFILATGDGDFLHVIRILQQEQKRVVVWGVDGSISARLTARVGELVSIQQLLARNGLHPSGSSAGAAPFPPDGEAVAQSSDLATRALILRAEAIMLRRRWVQVPFLTLLHELSASRLFVEVGEQRRTLVINAIERGILETKKQPNPKRPGTETTFILLRKEHPVVAQTLRAVGQVVGTMRTLLAQSPGARWVPCALLDRALSDSTALSEGAAGEAERRGWIELCVAEGLLRADRKQNPRAPAHPTSALSLVEEHPLVAQHVPGVDPTPLIRRLILTLDHYLTRTGYPWMSMGLLRRNLAAMGKEAMERTIRQAYEAGVVVIRQQPNQFGVRSTTGAYLQAEHPLVAETLAMRDRMLDELLQLCQGGGVVESGRLEERVGALEAASGLSAGEWLGLLLEHQILSPAFSANGEPAYRCSRQHPVVFRRSSPVS